MIGRCCVFQPFDNGPFEKRFKDIIEPAIRAADLDPYRVDRDDRALVPIETLDDEIKESAACLADISPTDPNGVPNPNVMFELGAALAYGKPLVIISSSGPEHFPFDIRHRTIVKYSRDSSSDFEKLKTEITNRLTAIVKTQTEIQDIVAASPVKSTQGLTPHEITVLALVMANRDSSDGGVMASSIRQGMQRAGFSDLATGLALTSLERQIFLASELEQNRNFNDEPYSVYKLTSGGEDWLLMNQQGLELRVNPPRRREPQALSAEGVGDDDVPF